MGLAPVGPLAAVEDGSYLAHGTVAFDQGFDLADYAYDIAAQPDGKILIVGTVSLDGGSTVAALTRLLPDGGIDPAFGGGTGRVVNLCSLPVGSDARAMHLLANGKIVIAGTLSAASVRDFLVWRLLADGSCDTSFGEFGITLIPFDRGGDNLDYANALAVDDLGRIVVVGSVDFDGPDVDMGVVRLTPDGALDTSFSGDGKATISFDIAGFDDDAAQGVAIDGNGRILVAGRAFDSSGGGYDFAFARLMDDGSLDSSFGVGGRLAISFDLGGGNAEFVNDVAVWADGEIVAAGSIDTGPAAVEWAVLRIAPNGSQVLGLHHGYFGFTSPAIARSLVLQPDGKILLAGTGQGISNLDFGVVRLLRNGSPDPSFPFGTGVTNFDFNAGPGDHDDLGQAVALDHDGRILVAGSVEFDLPDFDFGWLRLDSSYIFADGFEWGDLRGWASSP
jgi:uncharacterized delta-60 repeat protein